MEGIDGASGKGVILGEQEGQDLFVGIATIGQQSDHPGDEPRGVFLLFAEKCHWDIADSVTLNGDDLVIIEQVHHLGHHNAEAFGGFGEAQQGFVSGQDIMGYVFGTHRFNLAPPPLLSEAGATVEKRRKPHGGHSHYHFSRRVIHTGCHGELEGR